MKITITTIFSVAFILIVSLFAVQPVFAHGDDARIEISPEKLNPGGVLDIRGVGFESDAEVRLMLMGPQIEVSLETVTADIEGVFQLTTVLPIDLVEGVYVIRGTTLDGHTIDSPELMIGSNVVLGSAEGQPPEQEDPLLAPMPTLAVGAPTPVLSSPTQTNRSVEAETATIPSGLIAVGVGIAVLLVFILLLKRR